MEKVACFIHSTTMKLNGDTFLIEILDYLKDLNLLGRLTYLCINNTGLRLDEEKIEREYIPAKVIHCLNNTNEFENPTIKLLYSFCKMNPDYKVLYLHTKGVSYSSDHEFLPGVKSWNRFMRYCLIDHFESCLNLLRIYDTVGCNFRPITEGNPPHYSGNYWWANARYIQNLPIAYLKDKYDPEFWLLQNNPLYFNVLNMEEMYQQDYPIENYRIAATCGIEDNVLFCKVGSLNNKDTNMLSQLFCIANVITLASAQCGNKIVILNDFAMVGSADKPSYDVLDIPKCNELLKPHKITLIPKKNVLLEIHKVEYGLLHVKTADVTDKVKSRFFRHNHLLIPIGSSLNDLCDDPCVGMFKQIYIHYSLNSIPFHKIYHERNLKTHYAIDLKHDCYDGKPTSSVNTRETPWLVLTDPREMVAEFDMFLSKLILL
jgi:hypothetical protein